MDRIRAAEALSRLVANDSKPVVLDGVRRSMDVPVGPCRDPAGAVEAERSVCRRRVVGDDDEPFADVNLKLVVLSALLDAKAVDLGTPETLAAHGLGRPVDLMEEGYEPIPAALDYLARFPLTEALLQQVRATVFDGGNAIYSFVQYLWDGEDGVFDVSSLGGIEHCPNVVSLHADAMLGPIDARQLVPLTRLEELSAFTGLKHLDALHDLPGLRVKPDTARYLRLCRKRT